MSISRSDTTSRTLRAALTTAAALYMLLLLMPAWAVPQSGKPDPAETLTDADRTCLACHGNAGMKKTLANKETLSLQVPAGPYAGSVHAAMGCASCHADVDLGKHVGSGRRIESSRAYTVSMAQVCRQCHDDKYQQYEGSIHATLLRQGNPVAPVCTDCHGSHEVRKNAAAHDLEGVPCRKCHEGIYGAYIGSVHGSSRAKSGPGKAPICADCHRAHDVPAASTGDRPAEACAACHGNVLKTHSAVFPNAARHLEAISCAACHAPDVKRKVDLRMFDAATKKRMAADEKASSELEERIRAADARGEGLEPRDVWNLLKEMNANGTTGKAVLRGRLEVQSGVDAHLIADKGKALKRCESCHSQGAAPFQTVTISMVGPDGRPMRYEAQKELLSDPLSVGTVSGFYAIGGTRIRLLDVLLGGALLIGVSVPLLHLAVRRLVRRRGRDGEGAKGTP
jgi:hypothetical protein